MSRQSSHKTLLLIIPPQKGLLKGFATGLVSLAEYLSLKEDEIDTNIEILDWSMDSYDEIKIKSLEYADTDNLIVGVTTTTASYQSSLDVAKNFKRSNPESKIIFGGHHASADPETILKNHPHIVDYVIKGEGERALYKFLKVYPDVQDVPNLVYQINNEIVKNSSAPLLNSKELDLISLSYNETELYGQPGKFDTITYVSARGCPLGCYFCAVSNQKMRSKTVGRAKKDIQKLVDLGYQTISIEDNFFAHSPRRTFELCKELKSLRLEGHEFKWDCQTRVESLKDSEIIKAMEEAGCYAAYLGVEALNFDHLEYLGKTRNPERYMKLLNDYVLPQLLESKIDCYINLQLGIPESNGTHHRETLLSLKKIGDVASRTGKVVTIFPMLHVIYPGTKHYLDGVMQNKFKAEIFEDFTAWESKQQYLYSWLGENFAHGTGGIPFGILNENKLRDSSFEIEPERILEIQKQLSDFRRIEGIRVFEYEPFIN